MISSCSFRKSNDVVELSSKNEIIFLVLKIKQDSLLNKNVIEIIKKIKSDGVLKNNNHQILNYPNTLTFEINENNKMVKSIIIEHPLYKKVEYIEGDSLNSKVINLKEQEFFIRLQIKGESNQLKIYETLKDSKKEELALINL